MTDLAIGQLATDLLARAMQALHSYPCRCERGGWTKQPDGTVDRPVIVRCARCRLTEEYELKQKKRKRKK